jgi:hypothetical protein
MTNNLKHFAICNISFTQRESDSYLDASKITRSRDKPFPNWTRRLESQKLLIDHPIRIEKKRSWIASEFVVALVEWTVGAEKFDYNLLENELTKPFPTEAQVPLSTTKTYSKCTLEHPVNKLKPAALDIYCDKARRMDGKEVPDDKEETESLKSNYLDNIHILFRSDGYVNATELCRVGGKLMANYNRNGRSSKFAELLANKLGTPQDVLIQTRKGGLSTEQGTWVHPQIATNIANWISVEFSVNMSQWIEEWKNTSNENKDIYIAELERIVGHVYDQVERDIQKRLQNELGGVIEAESNFGLIDLLTDTELIEIKTFKHWKHGMGQLYAYSKSYPNHKCRLHLFEHEGCTNMDIESVCEELGIVVTYE